MSIELKYDDHGRGDALVLVHGHPFDRSMWHPQAVRFARSHRVIVPDLRGYGQSPVVPGVTTLEEFARDLAGLLDRLGVGEFVLAGLSMGGQIVLEFHRLFADRVRALVLADTFAQAETEDGRKARNAMADRLLAEGMDGYAEEALPLMVAPRTIERRPEVARHVLGMMRAAPPEGAAAALRGRAERPDYTATLAGIAVPSLVVVGGEDAYTPVADAAYMSTRIPGATLAVVDGAGHLPNLEEPERFNELLEDFFYRI